MPEPILVAIAGDSGAGKTTLSRRLSRSLGEDRVTHVPADHYHRYDRAQRLQRGVTPLAPDANHLDILEQDVGHLRSGRAILKPTYDHRDGRFGAAEYLTANAFILVEGLLALSTPALRAASDVKVFLAPPDDVRRKWKVQRDCSRRGYTTDQVLEELDRREPDAEAFIRPQRHHADIVVAFGDGGDQQQLEARLTVQREVAHPALVDAIATVAGAVTGGCDRAGG